MSAGVMTANIILEGHVGAARNRRRVLRQRRDAHSPQADVVRGRR